MTRWTTLLALLALCGCLEREEEIVVNSNGGAELVLTYRGDPGDFDDTLHFPAGDGWTVEKRREATNNDKGPSERFIWRATRTLADLNALPDCFAPADFPDRDRALHATTKLTVRREGDLRIYEFERTWPRTVSADVTRLNDAMLNEPEMGRLLEKMNKGGLSSLSEAESTRFFEMAASSEIEKQMALAWRVVDAWSRRNGVGWEDRVQLLSKVGGVYREALSGPKVTEAVATWMKLPEADRVKFATDFLTGSRRAAIEACGSVASVKKHGGFAEAYASEDYAVRSGSAATDDRFKLRVRFPGNVVGGNSTPDPADARVATWEFDGKDLQNGAVTLRAVAVERVK
ncbi:MAG: hypothetical protein HYY18_15015 [Planctomycetes bacterium]|nr:hypothetical protein [Planctomycetota bacterium]